MTRREFMKDASAVSALAAAGRLFGQSHEATGVAEFEIRQGEIDAIEPKDFMSYWKPGTELSPERLSDFVAKFPVLGRLEAAFEKVVQEVKSTVVDDVSHPAIWYVYNMGLIVKTPKTLFSIDLHHRRAEELAPLLDFALITHNHNDHYTERFKVAMDRGQHKPVVNNFFDNYGVADRRNGGYTRAKKTFVFGDVEIKTGLCDHNGYLIDYTTTFEIKMGDFILFHSGDCCSHAKLEVSRSPDMWVFHPRCGMNPAKACEEAIRPGKAVIAHLQELGHSKGRYRWTYRDGLNEKAKIEAAGFSAAMPLWGERIA